MLYLSCIYEGFSRLYLTGKQGAGRQFHRGEVQVKCILESIIYLHISILTLKGWDIADNPVIRLKS